jgi:hypothetical protein
MYNIEVEYRYCVLCMYVNTFYSITFQQYVVLKSVNEIVFVDSVPMC